MVIQVIMVMTDIHTNRLQQTSVYPSIHTVQAELISIMTDRLHQMANS